MINKDGIKISTLDVSNVSLTYIKLDSKKFESYYCEKPMIIGIDTATFFKAIKSANRRETITFYMDKQNPDKLGIELADPFMGKIKDYKIPLLALEEKVINIPEMVFDYVINIPSVQFQQIIKDIDENEENFEKLTNFSRDLLTLCSKSDQVEVQKAIDDSQSQWNRIKSTVKDHEVDLQMTFTRACEFQQELIEILEWISLQ